MGDVDLHHQIGRRIDMQVEPSLAAHSVDVLDIEAGVCFEALLEVLAAEGGRAEVVELRACRFFHRYQQDSNKLAVPLVASFGSILYDPAV
jgi:hypothetical protein